eukprot:gene4368-4949_t
MEVRHAFPVILAKVADISFVRGCYGDIVVPKVADGVPMNAARLLSIVGEGSIYLLPDKMLKKMSEIQSHSVPDNVGNSQVPDKDGDSQVPDNDGDSEVPGNDGDSEEPDIVVGVSSMSDSELSHSTVLSKK